MGEILHGDYGQMAAEGTTGMGNPTRQPETAVRADTAQGTAVVVAIPRGREVACRDAKSSH